MQLCLGSVYITGIKIEYNYSMECHSGLVFRQKFTAASGSSSLMYLIFLLLLLPDIIIHILRT